MHSDGNVAVPTPVGSEASAPPESVPAKPAATTSVAPPESVPVPKADHALTIKGMVRSFGAYKAVDVDVLEIKSNTITALIGPNGAGKTTLFNLITGFDTPDAGECYFRGADIYQMSDFHLARLGVVRTFQHARPLTRLTVLENMLFSAQLQRGEKLHRVLGWRWRGQDASNQGKAMDLLDRFSLAHLADDFAGTLSGGQRKLLEMARVLMADPKLVMLDEPLAGVNPVLAESILEHITNLKDLGLTVLFIEHDMSAVRKVSDWVVCLAQGKVIAEGTHEQVGQNTEVLDAYLGSRSGLGMKKQKLAPAPDAPAPDGAAFPPTQEPHNE